MSIQAFRNFSEIATLEGAHAKDGRRLIPADLSLLKNASIVFDKKNILWVGPDSEFPEIYSDLKFRDHSGMTLLPELVDCHTHLVFGGDRSAEYSMRLNGADYQEIAEAGGGILSTMKATNALNADQLFELGKERIERIHGYGVGTIEIKSGYGLNFEKEYLCSHVIDRLKKHFKEDVQILNTFMAAHAIPQGYSTSNSYLEKVVIPLLKKLAAENILDAVDIFHETGYFDSNDCQQLFDIAKVLGLPIKSHADEFIDNNGATLAVDNHALSTDHLLASSLSSIQKLASSQTVATLLPGTGFFLGKKQANARAFLDEGAKVAIASDFNPGSCHCDNVLLIASLAAPTYQMNQAELWSAITLNAAHALGLKKQGALIVGLKPRFSIFKSPRIDQITYNWGRNFSI